MNQPRDPQHQPQWQAPTGMGWSLSRPDGAGEPPKGNSQSGGSPVGARPPQPPVPPQAPQSSWGLPPQPAQQPHQPPSIDDYSLPPSRARWWLGLVALALIGALVWAGIRVSRQEVPPLPMTPASSAPHTGTTSPASVNPSAKSTPFTSEIDQSEGTWEITKHEWTDRGLEVRVTITMTRGSFGYTFFTLDHASVSSYDPIGISDADALTPGTVQQGEKVSGLVVFDKPRGDTTVYLANRYGRQVSALSVEG